MTIITTFRRTPTDLLSNAAASFTGIRRIDSTSLEGKITGANRQPIAHPLQIGVTMAKGRQKSLLDIPSVVPNIDGS